MKDNEEEIEEEVKSLLQKRDVNNFNFSNHESSGDWNDNVKKWNQELFSSENEEMRITWKNRNLHSVPKSKFRAYWKDRLSDSSEKKFLKENKKERISKLKLIKILQIINN